MSKDQSVNEPFKVHIRIRPLNEKEIHATDKSANTITKKPSEKEKIKRILIQEDNLLFVLDPVSLELNGRKERNFAFDRIFSEGQNNEMIFNNAIKSSIDNVLNGYNSTAIAYGVTGAGKTHTMFGDILCYSNGDGGDVKEKERGVCLYAVDYLFEKIGQNDKKKFTVKISYLEIYNEQVIDLLVAKSPPLMIVEDSLRGVVVPDITEYTVTNSADLIVLIIQGNSRRTMAPTNFNQFSSRSHAILQVLVEQRNKVRDIKEEVVTSKFLVVDLAGSERGGFERGLHREEGSNINKSLLSLGNCINILSDKTKRGAFIPYRDSKLTRLLKDSLGGNILTVMIACVSPSHLMYDETVNTLNYASRARKIQKKVTRNVKEVNVHISQYRDIIDSLKSEIAQLKDIIKSQQNKLVEKEVEDDNEVLIGSKSTTTITSKRITEEKMKVEESVTVVSSDNNVVERCKLSKPATALSKNILRNSNGNYANISILKKREQKVAQPVSMSLEDYKLDFEGKCSQDNIDSLEKNVLKLQSDKQILENFIENSKVQDKTVNEKYSLIKNYYEKYLELINDKLVDNIEQNMVLKFNMKEILDLNSTNTSQLSLLYSEIINLEKAKLDYISRGKDSQVTDCESELAGLKEEMINIQSSIAENETIKERISESLTRNLKMKKMLKKILLSLLTKSKPRDSQAIDQKNQEVYATLLKEKTDLETKNQKYEMELHNILQEKECKDSKLSEVQKELEELKKQLNEKEKKIQEMESKHSKEENLTTIEENQDDYIEKIEIINLHDDYFNKKKFIKDIQKDNDIESNCLINDNLGIPSHKKSTKSTEIKNSEICQMKQQERNDPKRIAFLHKKNSCDFGTRKIIHAERSPCSQKRSVSKNKFQEFDKIIESQLNEVYHRKAKQIGENVKKNLSGGRKNNKKENKFENMISISNSGKEKDIEQKLQDYYINCQNNINMNPNSHPNHSLSISCVSISNENCFNSELEIMESIPTVQTRGTNQNKNKNPSRPKSVDKINQYYQKHTDTYTKIDDGGNNLKLDRKALASKNIQRFINTGQGIEGKGKDGRCGLGGIVAREKPIQPNFRDYSPAIGLLHQARLEKQLKNQMKDDSENQTSNCPDLSSHLTQQRLGNNSKKAEDFLNEYDKTKRALTPSDDSFTNPTMIPRTKTAEAKLNSNEEQPMGNELKNFSPKELLKSIEVSLRHQKLSQYLEKK